MKTLSVKLFALAAVLLSAIACNRGDEPAGTDRNEGLMTKRDVARMLSSLPLGDDQLNEVYDAVNSSTANGYDEEYMMSDLLTSPGAGVGDHGSSTKASSYQKPIRSMIEDYLASRNSPSTKAGAEDVQRYLDYLQDSGMQIYWPYSENWDGSTLPLITFDPGNGAESNYAYVVTSTGNGYEVVDSVFVNENVAKNRPVWVINQNDDSDCVPLESFLNTKSIWDFDDEDEDAERYNLYIKDFTMLRNYDSWLAGASEFHCWCGAVNGFYATTEEQLKNYQPEITDFVVVVKRSEVGKKKSFRALLVTDFSDQLDKLAFLIVEDDGGTRTNWKCSASVKIKSKTYGFDVDIPYHSSDDVVWRGQLGATYFTKGKSIEGRFGDVKITFALE
jgi:hypothetical protein